MRWNVSFSFDFGSGVERCCERRKVGLVVGSEVGNFSVRYVELESFLS